MTDLVYICDWLPPDFGAVGQYSLKFAIERARNGDDVTLVGLSSERDSVHVEEYARGRLEVVRLKARVYDRSKIVERLIWTIATNLRLTWGLRREIRRAEEIVFTGSPPFLIHFLVPLNLLFRKTLIYRITDFHPECMIAEIGRCPAPLKAFRALTLHWRRRIDRFEALGEDQRRRLLDMGIPESRIVVKRDFSPVEITPETTPLEVPAALAGYRVLLYSGNFGVAHDHETFLEGYRLHHRRGNGKVAFWLNAIGAKADLVEAELRASGLPFVRTRPCPLNQLGRLLITPDAHLITLREPFVGYVLPSKVYGCVQSGRPIVYVGPAESDIHLVCGEAGLKDTYRRVANGDSEALAAVLDGPAGGAPAPDARRA